MSATSDFNLVCLCTRFHSFLLILGITFALSGECRVSPVNCASAPLQAAHGVSLAAGDIVASIQLSKSHFIEEIFNYASLNLGKYIYI